MAATTTTTTRCCSTAVIDWIFHTGASVLGRIVTDRLRGQRRAEEFRGTVRDGSESLVE